MLRNGLNSRSDGWLRGAARPLTVPYSYVDRPSFASLLGSLTCRHGCNELDRIGRTYQYLV